LTLLPFNFVRLGTLRDAVLWRLLPLPLACAVAVLPMIDAASATATLTPLVKPLSSALATPSTGIVEFIVVIAAMCAAAFTYTVGWVLNFALLAGFKRYSSATLAAAFSGGPLPHSWEKADASAKVLAAHLKEKATWSFAREAGPLRYIVWRGGILFGALVFVLLHIVLNLLNSQPIIISSLPLKYALWVLIGSLLAAQKWWSLKRAFRGEA
jgi:hypothetical protein